MRKSKKQPKVVEDQNLDRFADSSDEEAEDEEKFAKKANGESSNNRRRDADVEREMDIDDEEKLEDENDEDDDSIAQDEFVMNKRFENEAATVDDDDDDDDGDNDSSVDGGEEVDASSKMANAMGRILGISTKPSKGKESTAASSSTVVLAKTVTPLQKLQKKEKEIQKKLKEKRQANRERNLTALHLPLSIATTNTIQAEGHLSVAKELEQERFHRRVATRGVVALFNAISQHQRSNTETESNAFSSKRAETTKLTKHGFLDKIKTAAKSSNEKKEGGKERSESGQQLRRDKHDSKKDTKENSQSSWGALKDDYMLNPKKNWDEESSEDEEGSSVMEDPDMMEKEAEAETKKKAPRKRQRFSGGQ